MQEGKKMIKLEESKIIDTISIDNSIPFNEYGQMAQAIKKACAIFNNIQGTIISNKLISYKALNDNYFVLVFEQYYDKIFKGNITRDEYLGIFKKYEDVHKVYSNDDVNIRAFLHFCLQFLKQPYVFIHNTLEDIILPNWLLLFEKDKIYKVKV